MKLIRFVLKTMSFAPMSILVAVMTIMPADRCAGQGRDWRLAEANGWIYNDLDAGIQQARKQGRPLMVVLRCPP